MTVRPGWPGSQQAREDPAPHILNVGEVMTHRVANEAGRCREYPACASGACELPAPAHDRQQSTHDCASSIALSRLPLAIGTLRKELSEIPWGRAVLPQLLIHTGQALTRDDTHGNLIGEPLSL
jgi:hypothetical protein